MKYKLKSRLLAALACSGLVVNCQISANAQDDFGFIRPATAVDSSPRSDVINPQTPPIVQSDASGANLFPPISLPPIVGPTPTGSNTNSNNTPLPFAPARIGSAESAEYQRPGSNPETAQQVGYQQEQWRENALPPIVAGNQPASLPPIVSNNRAELPEIEVVQVPEFASLPPIASEQTTQPAMKQPLPVELAPPTDSVDLEQPNPIAVSSLPPMALEVADLVPVSEEEAPAPTTPARFVGQVGQAYSAAGVPLYAGATPELLVREVEPFPVAGVEVPAVNVPPVVTQDAPPSPGQLPMSSPSDQILPANVPQDVPVSPVPAVPMQATPSVMDSVQGPIQTGEPQMGQSYFQDSTGPGPVVASGCSSCGSTTGGCPDCGVAGSVVAGCNSCGANGCYNPSVLAARFNSCGCMSYARRYAIFDALYFDRDDGVISNSNFGALNNFEWEAGWRLTLGRRSDSTRGRELTYMGTLPIEQTRNAFSPTGLIQSRFIPVDGFSNAQISGFVDATQQSQSKETFFHSLEFNRVRWGWDVMKSYVGMRYVMIDDSYTMYSQSLGGDQGFFQMETMNHLIGPHIGAELYYDVGNRWSASLVSKLGVYANINETDTVLVNNGTRYLDIDDDNGTFSASYEFGLNAHLRLSSRARFRMGYNFIWFGEVASVADNISPFLSPSTGSNAGDSDDMLFHGASFGFEFYR